MRIALAIRRLLRSLACSLSLAAALLALPAIPLAAADDGPRPTIPVEKDPNRHQEFLAVAKAGGIDVLFLGDSITDGWRNTGKDVWDANFAPLKAANFGISADRTEHVIWRLRNGELDGISPRVAVLMIGTNNGGDAPADVALGIKTILNDIHQRQPRCRVLLLAIFPRGATATDGGRLHNDEVNKIIATYADGHSVYFLDIGPKFLAPDGTLSKDIMPDLLHPNAKGYQIEADAILDTVKQLLCEDPGSLAPVFNPAATTAKIARIQSAIATANLDNTAKTLEKLTEDKDPATAAEAKSTLDQLTAWKAGIDAEIAKSHDAGDLYYAAELAAGMEKHYGGDDAKTYHTEVAEWKKDPAFAAGKEYPKLTEVPAENRGDPRFKKMVDAFVKKYPDTFYAKEAVALLPSQDATAPATK